MSKKEEKRKITGKDIGALAGVSQSTVSRVLSSEESSPLISEETIKRIREIAEKEGYSPNPIARALRGEKTNLIGLVVREISDPFFAGVIEQISSALRKRSYSLILGYFDSQTEDGMQKITRILDSRQCDGMIFLGDLNDGMKYVNEVIDEGHPAVTLCWGKQSGIFPTVNCNNERGVKMLVEHLVELGHKDFVFIDGGFIGDIRERRAVIKQFSLDYPDLTFSIVRAESNSSEGGFKAMQALIDSGRIPSAVLGADDSLAIGILSAINRAGLTVPKAISVTGFDDIELAKFTDPPLTTIRQPIEEMANEAVQMLINLIDKKELSESELSISCAPKLIIRESTSTAR
jgi:DNA-binding LacI/PurR family transcriptional regulator